MEIKDNVRAYLSKAALIEKVKAFDLTILSATEEDSSWKVKPTILKEAVKSKGKGESDPFPELYLKFDFNDATNKTALEVLVGSMIIKSLEFNTIDLATSFSTLKDSSTIVFTALRKWLDHHNSVVNRIKGEISKEGTLYEYRSLTHLVDRIKLVSDTRVLIRANPYRVKEPTNRISTTELKPVLPTTVIVLEAFRNIDAVLSGILYTVTKPALTSVVVDKINSDKFGKDKSYEGKTILVSTITSAIPLNATTATRNKKQLSVEEAALLNDKIIDDNPITEEEALGFRPESNLLKFRMPSYYDRSLTSSGLGEKQKSYQYMMRSLPTSETADLFNYEMGFLPLSSLTSMPKELTLFADDVFSLSFDFTKQLTKAKEGAEPDPRSIFSGLEENKTSKKVSFTGYVKVDVPCSNCEVKFPIQFNGTLIANDSEQKQKLNTSKDVRCEFSSIRSEGIWRLNVGYQPMLYSGGNARFGKGQRYIRDAIIIDGLNISLIPVYARCRPIASKIEHSKATYDFDKSPDVLFGSSSQMRNAYDHIRTNSNFASYVALSNEDEENKRTATITAVSQSRIIVGFYAVPTQILDFETSRYPTANFADLEKAYNQLTENFENNRKLDANMCKRLISLAVVYHFSKGFASVGSLSKFLPFFVLSDVPQEIETYASSIFVQNNDRQFLDESVKTLLYTKDSEIKDKVNNLLPFTSEDGLGKEMGDFLKGRTQVEAFETNSVPSSVFAQMHYVRDLRRLAGLDVEDSNDFDNQKDVGENV